MPGWPHFAPAIFQFAILPICPVFHCFRQRKQQLAYGYSYLSSNCKCRGQREMLWSAMTNDWQLSQLKTTTISRNAQKQIFTEIILICFRHKLATATTITYTYQPLVVSWQLRQREQQWWRELQPSDPSFREQRCWHQPWMEVCRARYLQHLSRTFHWHRSAQHLVKVMWK